MAQTKQGKFEKTYHHIDAPTYQDDEYGKEHKKRILINPNELIIRNKPMDEAFRNPELGYLAMNHWSFKRKLDGENIRIYWDGEQALWNGKTNNFQGSTEFQDYMNSTFIEEIFEEKFGRDKEVYIYGEHMGPKVQGNELNLTQDELIIFDVEVNGTFLKKDNIEAIAKYFDAKTVYDFMNDVEEPLKVDGEFQTTYLVEWIDIIARNILPEWEGIVCSPICNIKDHNGKRIVVKIKNKDYNKNWRKK